MDESVSGDCQFYQSGRIGLHCRCSQNLGRQCSGGGQTINRLEAHLGVRLLQRTTRSMALTENGAVYYEKVKRIAADLESAQAQSAMKKPNCRGD